MKFFVSRQINWPDGISMVEIAQGGLDYANPGMLVPKFKELGEGNEYTDPREAVEAAILIRDAWKQGSEDDVEIGMGHTFGHSMPFDGDSDENLRARAEKLWEKLPKCAHCGEVMGKEKYGSYEFNEFDCCSERCAEQRYNMPDEEAEEAEDVGGNDSN